MWHNPTVEKWGYKDKLTWEKAGTFRGSLNSGITKIGGMRTALEDTQNKNAPHYIIKITLH
jgi:hypothetical protein